MGILDSRELRSLRAKRLAYLLRQKSDLEQTAYPQAAMDYVNHELEHFKQLPLQDKADRIGLEIAAHHYVENPRGSSAPVLSSIGKAWVVRELKRHRRSDIEFWAKIVLPLLSLIISIIALAKR